MTNVNFRAQLGAVKFAGASQTKPNTRPKFSIINIFNKK